MRQSFLLLLCLSFSLPVFTQVFEKQFASQSLFYGLIPTKDGNFAAIGCKGELQSTMQVWLAVFNNDGAIVWEKTFLPAGASARGYSVTQAADGGFLITGIYTNSTFGAGSFIMKTASQGSILWVKTIPGTVFSAAETVNGDWLAGARDGATGDPAVFRISSDGNIIWQYNYPSPAFKGSVLRIFPQSDGSFYAAGRGEKTFGFGGVFLIHATSLGDTLWTRSFDTYNHDQELSNYELGPLGAIQAPDGDVIIADGRGDAGGVVMLRYTPDGEKIWEKNYGTSEDKTEIWALCQDNIGNLYLAGDLRSATFPNQHNYLLKTSPEGVESWSRTYDASPGPLSLTGIAVRIDGTCIASGLHAVYNNNTAYLAGIDLDGYLHLRSVKVTVKMDTDENCIDSSADIPLDGWQVVLKSDSTTFVLSTGPDGVAEQPVPNGTYQVSTNMPSAFWGTCQGQQEITVHDTADLIVSAELLVKPVTLCPLLSISLTSPDLVRCNAGIYYVECRNSGTEEATSVKVQLHLDPWLEFESTPFPYTIVGEKYEFDLGAMEPLALKRFPVTVRLSCGATIGQTHCVEAEISPLAPCALPAYPDWSGASLKSDADCTGETVRFTVVNTGTGNMNMPVQYQIIADGWRILDGQIMLNAGQIWTLDYPARGRSVWLDIEQVKGHPGNDRPVAGWEGCGHTNNGFASTGFLNMFEHNGRDPHRSYACTENTRIVLPDQITAIPEGYGWYHLIPFDAAPEYIVKFQNPLAHTVQQVRVRIHLSPLLDKTSFQVHAASHPFQVKSVGDGVFDILFEAINLPDADQDSLGFRGYLRFKADMIIAALDTGSIILNTAEIYFDNVISPLVWDAYHFTAPKDFFIASDPSPYSDAYGFNVFGGSSEFDFCSEVVQNPDGSMFLLMATYSYGKDYDLVVVKTDGNGRGIWQKVYDFGGGDNFSYAVSDGEGGFVATGSLDETDIPEDYIGDAYLHVVRIDKDGNVLWYTKEKPGTGNARRGGAARGIIRNNDGNYAITGVLLNDVENLYDNFLLIVTPDGQKLWLKNYQSADVSLFPVGVRQTPDGGYLMAGTDDSFWSQNLRFQKVDADGITEWVQALPSYSEVDPEYISDFIVTPDSGFLWIGSRHYYDADSNHVYWPVLTRLDPAGNFLWRKTLDFGLTTLPYKMTGLPDGGCVFTGEIIADTTLTHSQLLIAAADANADLLWWKAYDANTTTYGKAIHQRENGQLLVMGQTQTNNYLYNLAGTLLIADPNGTLDVTSTPQRVSPRLITWPNPARGYVHVTVADKAAVGPFHWQLFNLQGKMVQEGRSAEPSFTIDLPKLSQGIYPLSVRWNGGWATRPVVAGQ